jgi:hypothetical protein
MPGECSEWRKIKNIIDTHTGEMNFHSSLVDKIKQDEKQMGSHSRQRAMSVIQTPQENYKEYSISLNYFDAINCDFDRFINKFYSQIVCEVLFPEDRKILKAQEQIGQRSLTKGFQAG